MLSGYPSIYVPSDFAISLFVFELCGFKKWKNHCAYLNKVKVKIFHISLNLINEAYAEMSLDMLFHLYLMYYNTYKLF